RAVRALQARRHAETARYRDFDVAGDLSATQVGRSRPQAGQVPTRPARGDVPAHRDLARRLDESARPFRALELSHDDTGTWQGLRTFDARGAVTSSVTAARLVELSSVASPATRRRCDRKE